MASPRDLSHSCRTSASCIVLQLHAIPVGWPGHRLHWQAGLMETHGLPVRTEDTTWCRGRRLGPGHRQRVHQSETLYHPHDRAVVPNTV